MNGRRYRPARPAAVPSVLAAHDNVTMAGPASFERSMRAMAAGRLALADTADARG